MIFVQSLRLSKINVNCLYGFLTSALSSHAVLWFSPLFLAIVDKCPLFLAIVDKSNIFFPILETHSAALTTVHIKIVVSGTLLAVKQNWTFFSPRQFTQTWYSQLLIITYIYNENHSTIQCTWLCPVLSCLWWRYSCSGYLQNPERRCLLVSLCS